MNYLSYYNKKIIKYDLVNKFLFKKTNDIPSIEKIILSFNLTNKYEIKNLAQSLLAVELISNQKGFITKSSKPNIVLKIKSGSPIGCEVTLNKYKMMNFIHRLTNEILPKNKLFQGLNLKKNNTTTFYSFSILDILSFAELEKNYYLFNNLPKLNITITFCNGSFLAIKFILKSFKF